MGIIVMSDNENLAPLARKLARMALKTFFDDKARYLLDSGCDELNVSEGSCLDRLAKQVENILSNIIATENITPDSKLSLPNSSQEIEALMDIAGEFIRRSIKRTLNGGSMFHSSGTEATVTNPAEAYEVGLAAGEDSFKEAYKANPEASLDELSESSRALANEQGTKVHQMMNEYFSQGVEKTIGKYMERLRNIPVTPENISTSRKEYRVERYKKAHDNC